VFTGTWRSLFLQNSERIMIQQTASKCCKSRCIPNHGKHYYYVHVYNRFRAFFRFSAPVPAVADLLTALVAFAFATPAIFASAVPKGEGDEMRSFASFSREVVEAAVGRVLDGEDFRGWAGVGADLSGVVEVTVEMDNREGAVLIAAFCCWDLADAGLDVVGVVVSDALGVSNS
jgi:hypothetical protein